MKFRPLQILPIVLWASVLVLGVYVWASRRQPKFELGSPAGMQVETGGAVFVDVPWKHLPDVSRFDLTDQEGNDFDSASWSGRAHAICFFFASCPSICRDLNRQVQRLNEQLRDTSVGFLSISVDPEKDTPEVLKRYAADYGAEIGRWKFLTGSWHRIRELGEFSFQVNVNPETHTDNLFLIDKWGRYRDRFKWDDPTDMKRFAQVARVVAAETSPPWTEIIHTRNALAGAVPAATGNIPWVREFHLTDQMGRPFYSRELTGEVWIANFFFTTCSGICPRQNEYLSGFRDRLQERVVRFVSITTDPQTDTVEALRNYSDRLHADAEQWLFCRGEELLTKRIAGEYFSAAAGPDHHTSWLFVVDKFGQVRGSFDWQDPEQEIRMLDLLDLCLKEKEPKRDFSRIKPEVELP